MHRRTFFRSLLHRCVAGVALAAFSLAPNNGATQTGSNAFEQCLKLTFDPLGVNVPVCTRVIASGALDDDRLADALAARAEANLWAITYDGGRGTDAREQLELALADLDAAVALRPSLLARRGEVLYQLGRFEEARTDFTDAIEADPASEAGLLNSRSFAQEALGELDAAIADLTRALELGGARVPQPSWLFRRAALRDQAGDRAGAIADLETVLVLQPSHQTAAEALARLRGEE